MSAGILRQEEGLREAGRGQDQGPAQDLHGHQVQQDDGLREMITKTTSQSSSLFHLQLSQASERKETKIKINASSITIVALNALIYVCFYLFRYMNRMK